MMSGRVYLPAVRFSVRMSVLGHILWQVSLLVRAVTLLDLRYPFLVGRLSVGLCGGFVGVCPDVVCVVVPGLGGCYWFFLFSFCCC